MCAMVMFSLRSNIKSTGLSTGTTTKKKKKQSTLSLVQECIAMATLVYAYGPTILTNPEPCELVAECIFYVLQQ